MRSFLFPFCVAAAAALSPALVAAQSFDASPARWTPYGDVVVAADPAARLVLTTAYDDEAPYNLSGIPAIEAGLPGGVEDRAGLSLGALDGAVHAATEGSVAVLASFSAQAGDRLQFRWQLATRDDLFPDLAFATLNGQLLTLGAAADASLAAPAASGMLWQTAGQWFTLTLPAAGSYTLAFGIVDVGDYVGVSTLTVGELSVSAVPEPEAFALWLAGLAAVGAVARRRARAASA